MQTIINGKVVYFSEKVYWFTIEKDVVDAWFMCADGEAK